MTSTSWTIGKWKYLGICLAYAFFSELLFIVTSEGWSTLFSIIYAGGFLLILSAILLVTTFFRAPTLRISALPLKVLLAVQAITLATNWSDCGSKSAIFVQKILNGTMTVCTNAMMKAPWPPQVIEVTFLVFAIVAIYVLVGTPRKAA